MLVEVFRVIYAALQEFIYDRVYLLDCCLQVFKENYLMV